jgi:hypothetical protein
LWIKAHSILRWMSCNSSSTVLDHYAFLLVTMEILWLALGKPLVLEMRWTISIFALFWENPGLWWAQIKDDFHILRWFSNVDITLVAHIHEVIQLDLLFVRLWALLLKQLLVSTFLSWSIECFFQRSLKVIREFLLNQAGYSFWGIIYFVYINWDQLFLGCLLNLGLFLYPLYTIGHRRRLE